MTDQGRARARQTDLLWRPHRVRARGRLPQSVRRSGGPNGLARGTAALRWEDLDVDGSISRAGHAAHLSAGRHARDGFVRRDVSACALAGHRRAPHRMARRQRADRSGSHAGQLGPAPVANALGPRAQGGKLSPGSGALRVSRRSAEPGDAFRSCRGQSGLSRASGAATLGRGPRRPPRHVTSRCTGAHPGDTDHSRESGAALYFFAHRAGHGARSSGEPVGLCRDPRRHAADVRHGYQSSGPARGRQGDGSAADVRRERAG